MRIPTKFKLLFLILNIMLLTSCSSLVSRNSGQNAQSSSLMEFLYPEDHRSQENRPGWHHQKATQAEYKPEIPTLTLPVKIGLAFVPSGNWHRDGIHSKDQIELLEKVKHTFQNYDYIDRIEVIPSTYLKGGRGFVTLEQVARLYDVDLMALVSYDQITQSLENNAALLYWTIVGMYVIPGNENSIQTFVDTAVFDVESEKMLFRAPGINKLTKRTTAIGIDSTLSKKSLESFDLAVTDMNINLESELARFATRVKEEKVATIEYREDYSGGGSVSMHFLVMVFALLVCRCLCCFRFISNVMLDIKRGRRISDVKRIFTSALFLIFMLSTAGCSLKNVSPDGEWGSVPSNPVKDIVLLPHEYTRKLNEVLQSIPLKKL